MTTLLSFVVLVVPPFQFVLPDVADKSPVQVSVMYGLEIVHTDPDGGDYGGHFLIYGHGDDDSTWGRMVLTGPIQPIERKPQ